MTTDATKPRQSIACTCSGVVYHTRQTPEGWDRAGKCPLCKAAPDLLNACQEAQEWIGTVTSDVDGVPYVNGTYDGFVDLIQKHLRLAIRKAEGQ